MTSASSMHGAGHSKSVFWDNPGELCGRRFGVGVVGGVQDGNIEISSTAVNEKNILFLDDKA